MQKSTRNVLALDSRVTVDKLDRFVVTKNELSLSLIDLPDNVNCGNRDISGRRQKNFVKNVEIFRKFKGGGQDDGVCQPRKGEDNSVCQHRGYDGYSVCQQRMDEDDSVC